MGPDNAEIYDRLTKLSDYPTSVITDAQGRRGAMDAGIKPLSVRMRLAGIALTVSLPPDDNLEIYKAMKVAQPGHVLVVDAGGFLKSAVWGELASMRALALGIKGLVVDGCVRDGHAHDPLGFPVFARGVVPANCPKERGGVHGFAVTVGGVLVHPGDLVFGDSDGVAVVPRERAEQVLAQVPDILAREARNRAAIRSGNVIPDWVR